MANKQKILVTGAAGFIGFHLCKNLIQKGFSVVGIDNINNYYDVNLKYARLRELGILNDNSKVFLKKSFNTNRSFEFVRMNLEDRKNLENLFKESEFDVVINLAAQAGVRYSIENPETYVESNIVGFLNILECCRSCKIKHLLYASSSSVYGNNRKIPFSVEDNVDSPISLYAATKKSNELMAHVYSHLFDIPTSGIRLFTVYGPWGRPDMAPMLFADAISKNNSINVYNNGNLSRDFTYIDDVINGIEILMNYPPNRSSDSAPYRILNIGCGNPQSIEKFITEMENCFDVKVLKRYLPMQAGDVPHTWADITELKNMGYRSSVNVKEGVKRFVKWFVIYNESKTQNIYEK